MSDIAWGVSGEDALNLHHKGETVQAVVLDIDAEKERISLGMKQLERGAPAAGGGGDGVRLNKNEVVTVTVLDIRDGGLEVQVGDDGATGFIKRSDLGRDRDELGQQAEPCEVCAPGHHHLARLAAVRANLGERRPN